MCLLYVPGAKSIAKGTVILIHSTKSYRVGGIAPLILNLGII
jgi:hypothetical protein